MQNLNKNFLSRSVFVIVAALLLSLNACTMQWDDNRSKSPRTTGTKTPTKPKTPTSSSSHTGKRPAVHVVQGGESFYSIAIRYGLDYKTLAAWNNMSTKDVIFRGQKLKLYPPNNSTSTSSSSNNSSSTRSSTNTSSLKIQWPLKGRIINRFNDADRTIKGIDIAGQVGQRIKAAAGGKVVYAGSGLVGLGNVIVLKHSDTYLTAYGYNDKLLFSEGENVKQGQEIAIIGIGLNNQHMLHFEVRKNGKPVDPMGYLTK